MYMVLVATLLLMLVSSVLFTALTIRVTVPRLVVFVLTLRVTTSFLANFPTFHIPVAASKVPFEGVKPTISSSLIPFT